MEFLNREFSEKSTSHELYKLIKSIGFNIKTFTFKLFIDLAAMEKDQDIRCGSLKRATG